MARFSGLVLALPFFLISLSLNPDTATAQLSRNFYAKTCPTVEDIVGNVVKQKINETFVTIPSILRLFFHDCFPNGCDASILIESTPDNTAEKDSPDNQSLAGDGFDVVAKAKAAVDANSKCQNKVSCADILAIATRDVIFAAGGPFFEVELGRLDSLSSTAKSVIGKLPEPTDKLEKLLALFLPKNFTAIDVVTLSGAHTVGFAHCTKAFPRIYNFSKTSPVDPTLNKTYADDLQKACPRDVDPRVAINMDPVTPRQFDNMYFKELQQHQGLLTSDQDLYTDNRTRPTVDTWANDGKAFFEAFVNAMLKLGRLGIKTGKDGNIRHNCAVLN